MRSSRLIWLRRRSTSLYMHLVNLYGAHSMHISQFTRSSQRSRTKTTRKHVALCSAFTCTMDIIDQYLEWAGLFLRELTDIDVHWYRLQFIIVTWISSHQNYLDDLSARGQSLASWILLLLVLGANKFVIIIHWWRNLIVGYGGVVSGTRCSRQGSPFYCAVLPWPQLK